MKITVDVTAEDLKQIQKITGQKKMAPAVRRALADFLQMRNRQAFVERVLNGKTDYALTNDEPLKRTKFIAFTRKNFRKMPFNTRLKSVLLQRYEHEAQI